MPASVLWLAMLAVVPQGQATAAPLPSATIRGQVVNSRTLGPIADALVGVTESSRTERTSADGRFVFADLAPGTYTVTVSTVGYIFVRRTVTVPAGQVVDLTVPLAEGTGTYEESVKVVAAALPEASVASVSLNSSALQDLRDIAADDPVRALQALPGASTGDDFRAEFSVRGSAFRHTGIVVDGTATSLLFHTMGSVEDPGSIAMINTDVLERASLSAGTHPKTHGDWLGATLAFDLREGSRDRRALRLAVSGTSTAAVAEGPIGRARRGSWLVSLRKSYVDWLVRVIAPDIESTVGFVDTQAKVGYDVTRRQHVELVAIGGRANYERPTATGANSVHRALSKSGLGSIGWRYTRDRLLLTQRLSFATNTFRSTGQVGQEQATGETQSWVWRADASVFANAAWQMDAGVKAERAVFTETLRDFASQSGGGLRVRAELPIDRHRTVTGGWAQLVRRGARGVVTGGARVSTDSATGVTAASPWLVADRVVGSFRIVGGVGRSAQYPALSDLGQSLAPLVPEWAWGVDAGVARPISPATHWRIALFRRRESNILRAVDEDRIANGARIVQSTFPRVASALQGTAQGVDVVIERHADRGPTGWIGYTWAHVRDRDTQTGETFDGDFDQRHTLNVFVQQRMSYRTKATVKLRIGSNFPIVGYFGGTSSALVLSDTRNQVRLPTYARLDLAGSRTFTFRRSRLTVFLEFLNALGRDNQGPGNGSIRSNLTAIGYVERLLPFVPSAGMLLEF